MKIFKINEKIEIVCTSESTRSGFRHLAMLFVDGQEHTKGKCVYYNRTWERFAYQSVLFEVVKKAKLSDVDSKVCKEFIENYKESDTVFKSTMMVAKLGNIFCDTKKDKNDWKKRMMKAGLESSGLQFPDDWDKLSEDDKEARLDGIIKMSKEFDKDGK